MLIKAAPDIRSSEITDRRLYVSRREFIRAAAAGTAAAAAGAVFAGSEAELRAATPASHGRKLENVGKSPLSTDEKLNTWEQITTYNNYYEFGVDKDAPSELARGFKTEPWTITVDGECARKGTFHLEDVLKGQALEERVYRHRCVEAWSMVIPWVGFSLSNFIKRCEPTGNAKFVEFTTLYDPKQMPGTRIPVLQWPYVEGLRMDEAIPNQDGAPIRLVVPWKYGFKSIKSIVKVRFVDKQPRNTWNVQAPSEYGFYSNVNPTVDHPRWSQASERRIGEFFKRKTLMFNGYGDQVASLYAGMDLRKNY